ncbi:double-strand break repair protein AddB [Alteriqipengyuania flavescens]|uniref:double-strand break repair protein AddB n=1 Tax=Alteriqipengyuania flavescens TaxID=3053610 RepID=UPI0025B424AA|nr:double-strand break repair protein AddB [Alteriqipengyuania flavescens]WJY18506.1 double-strand break repair protein AddB [Alteriqipengyuania flavescens]WJY24446.1 double-strand break repair protein AddB [Alteriqipengyuania flavescens]
MAKGAPSVYSIAAHRGFADALAAGLLPRYRDDELGLARLTLILPSSRAIRAVTEAFVRISGGGLLLPRMVAAGDLDLDEALGPLLDPLGDGAGIPPAVDPTFRWLKLAELIREEEGAAAPQGAALLRLARQYAQVIDRLLVEDIGPEELLQDRVIEIVGDLADHWKASTRRFARIHVKWLDVLLARGEVDAAGRRNRLFEHAAERWKAQPPVHAVVAAGVTSAAPALARLLRTIADLPDGAVVLPDLDLSMERDVWSELGRAGVGDGPTDPPFAPGDAVTHPQYHLKLLLNRMGIAREEVHPWHRAGMGKGPPARSHAISALFLPPQASKGWAILPADKRRLSGVSIMQAATPEEEAQAVALLVRRALAEPEKRVAVVTPDRGLARRIVAHLGRWNIAADDSAGRPLSQTAAGRVVLQLAEVIAQDAAPVALMALLGHPLVSAGDARNRWLRNVRLLEAEMRGPRTVAGLAGYADAAAKIGSARPEFAEWWQFVSDLIAPALEAPDDLPLADRLDQIAQLAEALCGEGVWAREDGRALSAFIEDLRLQARDVGTVLAPDDLVAVLRDAMEDVSVRPPYGGHPRVSIYGLLESRMNRADLVICAGLNEGTWPAAPSPDPVLPPPVLRALGVPGADFRIGLSAHDLAAAMGAPEVVLSRAARDLSGPAIPSRFLLRAQALLGDGLLPDYTDTHTVALARALDDAEPAPPYPQPRPMPDAEQRKVRISATALDRLRSDPYQFYAQQILRLRKLDALDAEPTAQWQGTLAHAILERWHNEEGTLDELAAQELEAMGAHPLVRTLWRPRLLAALEWVRQTLEADDEREVVAVEARGDWTRRGITIHGRVDRIDRMADGSLAIVDYKTGKPPSGSEVANGYALQLGTLGLIARESEFRTEGSSVRGIAETFEYWSLGRNEKSETGFGYIETPILTGRKRSGVLPEEFLPTTLAYLDQAIDAWILGSEPFTAKLNPDQPGYTDYDQLMRLSEWMGRSAGEAGA